MRKLFTAISAAAVLCATTALCGCAAELSLPESPIQSGEISKAHYPETSEAETIKIPDKPSAVPVKDNNRLSHTIDGVYSDGKYYTITVSGKKCSAVTENSVCIDGTYYDDLRMELFLDSILLDSLEIGVSTGSRFLIMESAVYGRAYGCTLISYKREFSADEYPDIIQLDFYNADDIEVPQYGRFFAVFDDKLLELPIYENGMATEPCGTHFKTKSAGVMTHCLCVSTVSHKYTVRKYEYSFNLAERRLDKREVRFYGWTVDN